MGKSTLHWEELFGLGRPLGFARPFANNKGVLVAMADEWEFWIDVGGTFTDLVARDPQGRIATHKLLSTGVYRGRIEAGSTTETIVRSAQQGDPDGFFDNWQIRFLGRSLVQEKGTLGERNVARFEDGRLHLDRPIENSHEGTPYELTCGVAAPVVGIRWLRGLRLDQPIGECVVRLGTTRGTNALLERKGASTALVITKGFGALLEIGYQDRPRLFALNIQKPRPIHERVLEVDERIDSQGNVLVALDERRVREELQSLHQSGIRTLAICLLNAYRNTIHEESIARLAEGIGFDHISVSTRLSPSQRIVPRVETAVVDAYLTPILRGYVSQLQAQMPEAGLQLMTSSGALVEVDRFAGKDLILSGPAGGVVGASHAAKAAGFASAIAFDMGGTSTDVSRYSGSVERRYVMELRDQRSKTSARVVAPMYWIETVAAGGGSICGFDGQKIVVGPSSAGASPGPACYGQGGPLTITDVNLYLGRLVDDAFSIPLDRSAVELRINEMVRTITSATGQQYQPEVLAEGFLRVANTNMSAAIQRISIARGHDVRQDALVSFGGAGGQHACALARELGISTVLQHPLAGVLSALGIGMAEVRKFAERHVGALLDESGLRIVDEAFHEMEGRLRGELKQGGGSTARLTRPRRLLELRYRGQDSTIAIEEPPNVPWAAAFEDAHRRLYGFVYPARPIEIPMARLELSAEAREIPPAFALPSDSPSTPVRTSRAYFDGEWRSTPVYRRDGIEIGQRIDGPAIVIESLSTIVVEPGWTAALAVSGDLVLTHHQGLKESTTAHQEGVDAVRLELFHRRFASIAEQMGVTLQKSAMSVNVKERLDFSCALFTAQGRLVVNAPHIPVHLGAMGETVRRLISDVPHLRSGEVYLTNDPFQGGSHLPDVTVVTPVFDRDGRELLFFTASRAHHAEIGGIVPGSMPPFSKTLAEEGVLIRWLRLAEDDASGEVELRQILAAPPYPSRAIEENIADIHAQIAANRVGQNLLLELVERQGASLVTAYMRHVQDASAAQMRAALAKLPSGKRTFQDSMDDASVIGVEIDIRHEADGGRARVDFTGTSAVTSNNLNANPAIVRAAVLYSFRCLIEDDIPLNDGVLDPVEICIPLGCMLNPIGDADPERCPAVGGGNVETSQRIVDVVLGALGVVAASQGTMNNFLFGTKSTDGKSGFGYYETICGGAGAGPGFAGASAVHTHMTNTRITDPEVLEDRYPVRLREFAIRKGSGGDGKYPGGDGVMREIEFLEDVDVSLVSNRRNTAPFGLSGGQPGASGVNEWIHANGIKETLGPSAQLAVHSGDRLRIQTPGGGGFGDRSS